MSDALFRIIGHSSYARGLVASNGIAADLTLAQSLLAQPLSIANLEAMWSQFEPAADGTSVDVSKDGLLARALRRFRNTVMLVLAERTIRDDATLSEVFAATTRLAEITTQAAINAAFADQLALFGHPCDIQGQEQCLLVIGMGKLGGGELNVSSDIDLVLVYREPGKTRGDAYGQGQIDCSDFFARVVRCALPLIQDITSQGFVFRVDLRLRPHGDAGPVAITLNYLEDYLLSEGRSWERFAWLRSRVVASTPIENDSRLRDIQALKQIVEPFVYRRYLDFSAIAALQDLHQKIQKEHIQRTQRKLAGCDVKLGRGGIREVEFTVQLLQVIRGGKDPSLRGQPTLDMLDRLEQLQIIPTQDATTLKTSYELLRQVENAVQWRADAQTHWLAHDPSNAVEQELIDVAAICNMDAVQLWEKLTAARGDVASIFDGVLGNSPSTQAPVINANPAEHADEAAFRLNKRYSNAREETQSCVDRLLVLARQQLRALDQETHMNRVLDLFEKIIGRPGYLALLLQYPLALTRLCKLLVHSTWAANYINRHPVVLDELISGSLMEKLDWPGIAKDLTSQLAATQINGQPDVERLLDTLRETHHAIVMRLLAQDVDGSLSVEVLSDELSALADCLLAQTLHCIAPDITGLAIIAYGKLGGKELGYASDLDIVFLYESSDAQDQEKFTRIIKKLSHWLSVQTGAGQLYDVDLRLRPDGDSGLLVSSLNAFERYQLEAAWPWEHQALTRARFAAGDIKLKPRFDAIRDAVLVMPRDPLLFNKQLVEMRVKIHAGHPNRSELFDLKHDTGGMVDIEFITQQLVLLYAKDYPQLLRNIGNVALLLLAGDLGLIDKTLAQEVAQAYRSLRKEQHRLRLNDQPQARSDPANWVATRRSVTQLWQVLHPNPAG